jgi:hypothetical protein
MTPLFNPEVDHAFSYPGLLYAWRGKCPKPRAWASVASLGYARVVVVGWERTSVLDSGSNRVVDR